LVEEEGPTLTPPYGKKCKQHLKQRIAGYNQSAHHSPWVVLMDLNHDADCAPPLKTECPPAPARYTCFRIAVRTIETWLLADSQSIARFLSVAVSHVPSFPEMLDDPKQSMVDLAQRSRRREIRESMVPRPGSGRKLALYTPRNLSSLPRPDGSQRLLRRDRIAYAAAANGSMSLSEIRPTNLRFSRLTESEVDKCQASF
jgi:hypothetical protein